MKDIILVFLAIIFAIFIFWYLYKIDFVNIKEGADTRTSNPLIKAGKNIQRPTIEQMAYIESVLNHTALNSSTKVEKLKAAPGIGFIPHVLDDILNNTTKYPEGQDGDAEKINDITHEMRVQVLDSTYEGLEIYYPLCSLDAGGNVFNQANETNSYGEPIWEGDHSYDGVIYGGTLDHNEFRGAGDASIKFTPKNEDCSSSQGGTFIKLNKIPTFYQDNKFTGFTIALWAKIDREQKSPRKNQWYSRFFDFATSTEGGSKEFGNYKEFGYYNNNILATYSDWAGNFCFCNATGSYSQPGTWNGIWSDSKLRDDQWRHFAFIMDDKGVITYYINGNLVKGDYIKSDTNMVDESKKTFQWGSTPMIPKNVERDLSYIGRSNFFWDSYFSGNMADFRIYSKAISQDTLLSILKIQRKTIDAGGLLNGGGSFGFGGGSSSVGIRGLNIRLNFNLNGRESRTVSTDQNNNIIWKNQYNPSVNNAYASNSSLTYCNKTGKITIPSGQYMKISSHHYWNLGVPFTLFIVVDLKSINNYNFLFGSDIIGGFDLLFLNDPNIHLFATRVGTERKSFKLKNQGSINPVELDVKGINIFTITCDAKGAFNIYLNSKKIGKDNFSEPPKASNFFLGATVLPWHTYASVDDLDFYNVMHFSGVFPEVWLRVYESYFASKYKIKQKLSKDDNVYAGHNFTWFPF